MPQERIAPILVLQRKPLVVIDVRFQLIRLRYLSKQELLEKVWGDEFDGDPNVVEVYIGYLRRKIDRPFDRNDIETVRGVGYRIGTGAGG